jgi:hypothetical protein
MSTTSGSRSSTFSHFSKGYATATAGTAAHDFYGIPLTTDLSIVEPILLLDLALLVVVLLVQHKIDLLQTNTSAKVAFWSAVLAVCYALPEVTLYPIISLVIFTRTSYPYMVVICHCISACVAYRKERGSSTHYFKSFALGFFCFGFGGSIVSDLLMGLPVTAIGHSRIIPCWILGWTLVWYSPYDVVYQQLTSTSTFAFHFVSAWEAVDAVTTPMGRVSRSARELQNKIVAPIMAGVFAGAGGAAIRYGERVILHGGDSSVSQSSAKALETGAWKNLGYSVLWWYLAVHKCDSYENPEEHHCHEYNGHNMLRLVIVAQHCLWNLACDLGYGEGHFFVWASEQFRYGGYLIANFFNLGTNKKDKKQKGD